MIYKKVAVYGSLKKGHYNHHWLEHCPLVRTGKIKGTMYSMGSYPMLMEEGNDEHDIEVYDVDEETFESIEQMEIGAGYKEKVVDGAIVFFGADDEYVKNKKVISKY
jgi:hypothetical protein